MSSKPIVKVCTACGQGFAEDNTEVGGRLTKLKCLQDHEVLSQELIPHLH